MIYDEFSVPGLAVYEKSKHKFDALQNEIREINSRVEQLRQPLRTSCEEREAEVLRRIHDEHKVLEQKNEVER